MRLKYQREGGTWTARAKAEALLTLGVTEEKTIDPLLQLVAGPREKFQLVRAIVDGKSKNAKKLGKVGSDAKFRCLQGRLDDDQRIALLQKVVNGELDLKQMAAEAEKMKTLVIIKEHTVKFLGFTDWEEVCHHYTEDLLNESMLAGFVAQFQKRSKGEHAKNEMPAGFRSFLEQVRLTGTLAASARPAVETLKVNNTNHRLFNNDVKELVSLISKDKKTCMRK